MREDGKGKKGKAREEGKEKAFELGEKVASWC